MGESIGSRRDTSDSYRGPERVPRGLKEDREGPLKQRMTNGEKET